MIGLRHARDTDAGKVGAILTEFSAVTDWMPVLHTGAEDVAHAGRLIDKGWVIIAQLGRDVVGFAACDGVNLDALYVLAEVQGHGVGTALMRHLQETNDHLALWTFQANDKARQFYYKHGFVEVAHSDGAGTDEGLPDVRLEWHREAP